MNKSFVFLAVLMGGLMSCRREFSCDCDYKQRSIIINEQGNQEEVRTDEKYNSSIKYTSRKLANEECDERGRSIAIDTMRIEVSCKVTKDK
jgi:hypothetical protein